MWTWPACVEGDELLHHAGVDLGAAHAGAEGDDHAAVYALRLEPTQLRISRTMAAAPAEGAGGRGAGVPEVARIIDGKITIAPAATARDKARSR